MFQAEFLLHRARLKQCPEQMRVRQTHGNGPAHQADGFFQAIRKAQPARQPQYVHTVARPHVGGVAKSFGDHARQARQRHDIEHVVVEDRQQAVGALRPQVFKEDVGDHFTGNVAGALHAQNLVLQIHQTAVFKAQFEEPSRTVEQIQVLHAGEGVARAGHGVAGFEQGLVIAATVIGNQNVEAGEVCRERMQH